MRGKLAFSLFSGGGLPQYYATCASQQIQQMEFFHVRLSFSVFQYAPGVQGSAEVINDANGYNNATVQVILLVSSVICHLLSYFDTIFTVKEDKGLVGIWKH